MQRHVETLAHADLGVLGDRNGIPCGTVINETSGRMRTAERRSPGRNRARACSLAACLAKGLCCRAARRSETAMRILVIRLRRDCTFDRGTPHAVRRSSPDCLDNRQGGEEGVRMQRFQEATPMHQDQQSNQAVPES